MDIHTSAQRNNQEDREGYLKLIADSVPILIAYLSPAHRFLFNNDSYGRWFGPQYRDMRGRHLRELVGEDGYEKLRPRLEEAFEGKVTRFETEVEYVTGQKSRVDVTYVPDRKMPHKPKGVVALVDDISDRKRILRSLHAVETRFRLFMANNPALSFIKDTSGKFLFVSKGAESILGIKPDEWVGTDGSHLFPALELADHHSFDRKVLEGDEAVELVERLTGRKGVRDLLVVKFPFEGEDGERLLGGISLDITERMRAEQALLESEEKFRSLANALPQLMWMADRSGRINWYNQRWYEYTGLASEEAQGEGWQKVLHPDHAKKIKADLKNALEQGIEFHRVVRLRRKDGIWRWFHARNYPIRNPEGKVIHWVGTATDITESRKLQEEQRLAIETKEKARLAAEAANAAKSAFLANMSHEIRTPLGIIIGFSELLRDESLPPEERQQYVETIIRNGNALTRLISDILDLSKIEAGKVAIESVPFQIREFLDEIMDMFRPTAAAKQVEFLLTVAEGVPLSITSDPARLRQILVNLLSNAIKFTEAGHVSVSVEMEVSRKMLVLKVRDTGIGMTTEKAKQLFQPFFQGDPTISRRYGGTGLGLALARHLARMLGGDLILEGSAVGQGTSFVARIASA